jgi:3-deoxy-D-arabino-heptulosonate 7-phosphate (DAHP) synthase
MRRGVLKKANYELQECDKCSTHYDRQYYKPYLMCDNRHTLCNHCLGSLKEPACPFCSEVIEEGKPAVNSPIYNSLPSSPERSIEGENEIVQPG